MYYRAKTEITLPWLKVIPEGGLLEVKDGLLYYNNEPICSVGTNYCDKFYELVDAEITAQPTLI